MADRTAAIAKRKFGKTDAMISCIGFGGHHVGDAQDVNEAKKLLHQAVDKLGSRDRHLASQLCHALFEREEHARAELGFLQAIKETWSNFVRGDAPAAVEFVFLESKLNALHLHDRGGGKLACILELQMKTLEVRGRKLLFQRLANFEDTCLSQHDIFLLLFTTLFIDSDAATDEHPMTIG